MQTVTIKNLTKKFGSTTAIDNLHKAEDEQADKERLPYDGQSFFLDGVTSFCPFLFQRTQDVIGVFVYNFATVNDFLSIQDISVGP